MVKSSKAIYLETNRSVLLNKLPVNLNIFLSKLYENKKKYRDAVVAKYFLTLENNKNLVTKNKNEIQEHHFKH